VIADTLSFLLDTLGTLFGSMLLLRAYLHAARLHSRNSFTPFVMALTDWAVLPLRRLTPLRSSVDWASILAAFICAFLLVFLLFLLRGLPASAFPPSLLGVAVLWIVKWALYLVMWLTLIQAVISWVNPTAPVAPMLNELTAPFLAPIRRVIPPIGGVDLSPLFLFLLAQIGVFVLGRISLGIFGMA
jgi:YggT family protein